MDFAVLVLTTFFFGIWGLLAMFARLLRCTCSKVIFGKSISDANWFEPSGEIFSASGMPKFERVGEELSFLEFGFDFGEDEDSSLEAFDDAKFSTL